MADLVQGQQVEIDHGIFVPTQYEKDLEQGVLPKTISDSSSNTGTNIEAGTVEDIRAHKLQNEMAFFRRLWKAEEWLNKKMGIETQGVDRILEENKNPPSILNVFFLWWSLTCHVGTIPIGLLGPEFGLDLNSSIAAIVAGTVLGALCTAYTGTLGPKLGLRAIATSRYSFGFYGAKLCSILNIVIGGGFAVVNIVVVGQILSAVSDYTMPEAVGCVIIAVLGYVLSVFGFKLIQTFEKYSWMSTFIIICVLYGQTARYLETSAPAAVKGLDFAGSWLSFMAICFSSASGWSSAASDYYCNYPATTKPWKIFSLTFIGLTVSTVFATVAGACLGNAALSSTLNPSLGEAYENHQLGGLLLQAFYPIGFSKFCLVLLAFSVLGNNVAINYSGGLSLQLLGHYFHAVPRFVWSFFNAIVVAGLAIAGQGKLSLIISNFVSLLGYWAVSFTFIILIEDQWFRRHSGYQLTAWDQPKLLPLGLAAILALLVGYLAGGVPGMAQTWYIGPIAAYFGGFGGDVGIYLSGIFTIIVYFPARWVELKKTGR